MLLVAQQSSSAYSHSIDCMTAFLSEMRQEMSWDGTMMEVKERRIENLRDLTRVCQ